MHIVRSLDAAGQDETFAKVRWTHIALGASLVAISALIALAVVGAIRNVESLAAIALALAVLAFVIQIVVFIVQTWTTSRINAETQAFLSELRTSTRGTEKHLVSQVDKLTDHIMGRQRQLAKSGFGNLDRDSVREEVASFFQQAGPSSPEPSAEQVPVAGKPVETQSREEFLTYPPEDRGLAAAQLLRNLSPLAMSKLKRFADDHRDNLEQPFGPGLPENHTHSGAPFNELKAAGLIEPIPWPGAGKNDSQWYGLTSRGCDAARLLVALGPEPDWLLEAAGPSA